MSRIPRVSREPLYRTTVFVSRSVWKRLGEIALDEGLTTGQVVRRLLAAHVRSVERRAARKQEFTF